MNSHPVLQSRPATEGRRRWRTSGSVLAVAAIAAGAAALPSSPATAATTPAATTPAATAPKSAPVLSNAFVPRPTPTGIETVLGWYDTTAQAIAKSGWTTGNTQITATRTWVVAWGAAEEAATNVVPKPGKGKLSAVRQAAIAFAIHDVLVSLTPSAKALVDQQLQATIDSLPEGTGLNQARSAGEAAAANWTTKRLGDGLDVATVNRPFNIPAPANGVWRLTGPGQPVQAGQGSGEPFLVKNIAGKFIAPKPPAYDSPEVIADLNEIDKLGSLNSTERGPERTQIARFWSQTSVAGFTSILRDVLTHDTRGPLKQAHIIKTFHQVVGDAQIAIYASKYRYLTWRPVTALTTDDGNPATPYDPKFVPFISTPLHPEYPSGHVGYAAAAEVALKTLIGKTPVKPIRAQSTVAPGVFNAYTTWGEITDDNVNARVWEGIHLRSTNNLSRHYGYKLARASLRAAGELK